MYSKTNCVVVFYVSNDHSSWSSFHDIVLSAGSVAFRRPIQALQIWQAHDKRSSGDSLLPDKHLMILASLKPFTIEPW